MGENGALLELEDLAVHYGSFVAIPGLTLRCERGAVGLLGPNGAGKSSLLKAVLGLVPPASGAVRVLGHVVPAEALEVRRRVGYMPESACHFPGLTGFENVAYAGQISGMPWGEARRRAHEVLEYVMLGEERYRNVDDYSTGQRQKVKLAAALVHDPDLLLLDEPTNGLDPKGRIEILHLIRDLAVEKGISVVLSSHLLTDVELVCQSIVVISRGSLRASGTLDELKSQVFRPQVRLTLAGDAVEFLDKVRASGFEAEPIDPLDPHDCVVTLPDEVEARQLLTIARDAGCQVRRFIPRGATLEEVFLTSIQDDEGPV